MKILIIDNFDSFTFNLYQVLGELLTAQGKPFELVVRRNNEITLAEIKRKKFDRVVISPGPGHPADPAYFGVSAKVLTEVGQKMPVLGVCLGFQGLVHYFGGKIQRAKLPRHGKTSLIAHDGQGIFEGLPQGLEVMRYHSLVADPLKIPKCLEVTAVVSEPGRKGLGRLNKDSEIMGIRHRDYALWGVQFHPESFATEGGKQMLNNFLKFSPKLVTNS